MTVREDVLRFLREPSAFATQLDATGRQSWLDALAGAQESIATNDDLPLRPAQEEAWRGLAPARAGLVLGPPGTGKTHLLSWLAIGNSIVARASARRCRVFITAFTRNAAANLLGAIAETAARHMLNPPPVIYLGSAPPAGLNARVNHIERLDKSGLREALDEINLPQVFVACSVWSLAKLMQSASQHGGDGWTAPFFDLVCIDEASQMVLGHGLLALAGLAAQGRVVVAGDDRQLPPVRTHHDTVLDGRQVGGSLYSFLSSVNAAEFVLRETFRLNSVLSAFPAAKFYGGEYVSAKPVESRRVAYRANWDAGLESWERAVLDPEFPIAILLHDGPPAATANDFEAMLVARLARRIRAAIEEPDDQKFWNEQLAVVSPHRAQNAAIRSALGSNAAVVETVDRIQGKERDALILSYCVADPEFALAEAEFIFSRERFNVAITRARSKLIIVIARKLLDIVPPDQDVLDNAELLREYIYGCTSATTLELAGPQGIQVSTNIRLRGFSEDVVLPVIDPTPSGDGEPKPTMSAQLQGLLEAIRAEALANAAWGSAASFKVARRLARQSLDVGQLRDLMRLGHISLEQRNGPFGSFWSIRPFDPPRVPFLADAKSVGQRIEEVLVSERIGRKAVLYSKLRNRFVWIDASGNDVLWPQIEALARTGKIRIEETEYGPTVDLVRAAASAAGQPLAPLESRLSDEDFGVLNRLEDIEARRINFGIVESWTSIGQLAEACGQSRTRIADAVARLEQHGFVLVGAEQRLRSRMAELAREVRYIKQRFAKGDASRRPFLVRGLKVQTRDRRRPRYDLRLSSAIAELRSDFAGCAPQLQAISALEVTLQRVWGKADPDIAAFQRRGLQEIARSWYGRGPLSYVVTAETGSGKTEAACLPLILCAAADVLSGQSGTRAILVYPRIRLAANQAQRISRYLAALAGVDGMPTLTLGLQTGQVPQHFGMPPGDWEELWPRSGQGRGFPFFTCPACNNRLVLKPDAGVGGSDRLDCLSCGWHYDGWVGSKRGLRQQPPHFFLPTTESLHQWLHDPSYAALFGDLAARTAPRAMLADEIHLYTHVHGAQVGFALRRLLARAEHNHAEAGSPIAIGMSATLGRPIEAWSQLVGRTDTVEIRPATSDTSDNPRAREYFYFVQPEVESRGRDIAGASTTIQSLMCLAHGMRRRTGTEGGYRGLVFLDSIDKLRRLHSAYGDAEEAKCLATYRTRLYDDSVNGEPRTQCCRDPVGCDAFREGECWYFAATDERQWSSLGRFAPGRPLKVAERPIFSGTTGRAEDLIKESDVVFTTSSLEVGYDDPDIALVYQHYSPRNLASFVQRKGRAGRGSDDRSITAVTLSPYSPRDSWYFRRPELMIEPSGFEIPLNPDNFFVLRGQLLAAFLDGFARFEARCQISAFDERRTPRAEAIAEAVALAVRLFGQNPWECFGANSAIAFWEQASSVPLPGMPQPISLPTLRRSLAWVPDVLFDTVNLPVLVVRTPERDEGAREDITLALAYAAPGNVTRRFDTSAAHWIVPRDGLTPWLEDADYEATGFEGSTSELIAGLPNDIRESIAPIHAQLYRPVSLRLATTGQFWGADWRSKFACEQVGQRPAVRLATERDNRNVLVHHESRAFLNGSVIVAAQANAARPLPFTGIESLVRKIDAYHGDALGRTGSGLVVTQVYWGADAEVRLQDPTAEAISITQRFKHPQRDESLLHGYRLETEGIRIAIDSVALDRFIAAEVARMEDTEEHRWHAAQMLRYLLESRARCAGINGYDARRGAELLVSAAGHPELKKRLKHLLRFWDAATLKDLLEDTRQTLLAHHPLLTGRRVERTAAALGMDAFREQLQAAISEIGAPESFGRYLRSVVLHSLAVRLKQSFVLVSRGQEDRVLMHIRLPIQFGDTDDVITLAEVGERGDGTTRTFVRNVDAMLQHWHDGFLCQCPSAREDAVVERVFELAQHHARWRELDPRNEVHIRELGNELGAPDLPLASAIRILFGSELIGSERFTFYDLTCEIRQAANRLNATFGRQASVWELVSAAVAEAQTPGEGQLGALLRAYAAIDDASQEGSLGAPERLADQVYRLSSRFCVDGCQNCVHTGSDMMSTSLTEASTSRRLLERFLSS